MLKVSVVMAAYNSQSTISSAIHSFLVQDYPKKELILVDGGSSDNTMSIVESFNHPLIKFTSEPDRGIYDAMNKGLRQITGGAFGFLNSDDCYGRPDALCLIAQGLEVADVVSGGLHFVKEHDGSAPVRVWYPEKHGRGSFGRGFSLPHPTTYARREVLDRVGEFSTHYRSASDYDWLLRALEIHGFSHGVIDAVLVNMRIGGESTAGLSAILRNSRETLEVRQRWLGSGLVDKALFLNLMKKLRQCTKHPRTSKD